MSVGLYSGVSGLALGFGLYKGFSGLWSGASGLLANSSPSLSLDFLTNTTLDPRITFSRTTNATLVDATGQVTYAPNNLVLRSEQFDNAAWTNSFVTVTADTTVSPDGTTDADTITEDTSLNAHFITGSAVPFVAGAYYISSIYAKYNGRFLRMFFPSSAFPASARGAVFNLQTGAFLAESGVTASIVDVGDGWYRCSISRAATTTASAGGGVALANNFAVGTQVYLGDGTSGAFIWGAQFEAVTYQTTPSTYVQTVASAYYGPRFDYNPVTLAPRGLLIEEQRANLALYSEQFDNAAWVKSFAAVTANATTSPDGTTNADRFTADGSSNTHAAQQTVTYTAAAHTFTAYAKRDTNNFVQLRFGAAAIAGGTGFANFDLNAGTVGTIGAGLSAASITPAGNGWYRCTITGTTAATSTVIGFYVVASATAPSAEVNSLATSVFLYGAQLEVGAFATSYIPTVASTVTRASDNATMTGTNFSSWYNASEGTIVVSADSVRPTSISPATRVFQFDDGTGNNNIRSAGTSTLTVVNATALQAFLLPNPAIPFDGTVFKFASAYKENDFASVTTGAVATDTSGTVPTVTQLALGSGTGAGILNGHIRSITYYPSRLANAQMQELAAPPLVASLSLDFVNGSYQG
jgi:hypothetical protein